jgi:hypothetical protein
LPFPFAIGLASDPDGRERGKGEERKRERERVKKGREGAERKSVMIRASSILDPSTRYP